MSSSLRSISALLGIILASPLAAQAPALKLTSTAAVTVTPATVKADTVVTWVELRSNQGELRGKLSKMIKAEIVKAKARGMTVFLELGATWCGPCKMLEELVHTNDKAIVDAFSGAYMIHLDVNEWDVNDELAYDVKGTLPMMLTIDERGKVTGEVHGMAAAEPIKSYVRTHLWKKSAGNKLAVNK